jgi:4-hydroxysphinganine ceramide fatty acyl 2-hydroxylase
MSPLPFISLSDVQQHNTAKSCYVTVGRNVYDVTDFVEDHPGGADLILNHAGSDVTDILKDEISHAHTDAAYEILDESLVGYLATDSSLNGNATGALNGNANGSATRKNVVDANGENVLDANGMPVYETTGMSCAEDLSRETNFDTDYKTFKFLDLNKPLLMQVWRGGFTKKFYLEQVHRPRHYRGGDSAPLFGNFLEPLSKTPWWVVPSVWIPWVAFGTWKASQGLSSNLEVGAYWGFGLCLWSLIEYGLHRCLFHLDE